MKRNAIAGLSFTSFAALEAHLARWILEADQRVHGTTHKRPLEQFEKDERAALRPLPARPLPMRDRRITRRAATDCFVDVNTIRYSVPHRLVKQTVEVLVGDHEVVIFDGHIEVARHRRHDEPHQRIVNPRHFDGLFRQREDADVSATSPIARSLDVYAEAAGGAA